MATAAAVFHGSIGHRSGAPGGAARLLEYYGVPSARYDTSARLVDVSAAASDLFADDLAPLLDQATQVVARLMATRYSGGVPPAAEVLVVPGVDRRTMLRAQLLPAGERPYAAVVLFLPAARSGPADYEIPGLSAREREVARHIASGAATKVVAARLGISVHTARRHTERVFAKLGIRSRGQLMLMIGGDAADRNGE